jgi:hypothetical protein
VRPTVFKTSDGKWKGVTLEQKELAQIEKVSSQHCLQETKTDSDVWRVRFRIPKKIAKHISEHFVGHRQTDWIILVLPGCEKSLAQAFADRYVHPEWRSLQKDLIILRNQPTREWKARCVEFVRNMQNLGDDVKRSCMVATNAPSGAHQRLSPQMVQTRMANNSFLTSI